MKAVNVDTPIPCYCRWTVAAESSAVTDASISALRVTPQAPHGSRKGFPSINWSARCPIEQFWKSLTSLAKKSNVQFLLRHSLINTSFLWFYMCGKGVQPKNWFSVRNKIHNSIYYIQRVFELWQLKEIVKISIGSILSNSRQGACAVWLLVSERKTMMVI